MKVKKVLYLKFFDFLESMIIFSVKPTQFFLEHYAKEWKNTGSFNVDILQNLSKFQRLYK